jgi:MOSC domain-containing protein YiiM
VTEGDVKAGDQVEILARDPAAVPISEITRLFTRDRRDAEGLRRALAVDALPVIWRPYLAQLLERTAR